MWCCKEWELNEAEGRVNWEMCYNDMYIADIQGKAVLSHPVLEEGRCNQDLHNNNVIDDILTKI